MIVDHTDDKKRLVYGVLDKPVNDYAGKVKLGSQLAVSYDNIREHKKAAEFKSQNWNRFSLHSSLLLFSDLASGQKGCSSCASQPIDPTASAVGPWR